MTKTRPVRLAFPVQGGRYLEVAPGSLKSSYKRVWQMVANLMVALAVKTYRDENPFRTKSWCAVKIGRLQLQMIDELYKLTRREICTLTINQRHRWGYSQRLFRCSLQYGCDHYPCVEVFRCGGNWFNQLQSLFRRYIQPEPRPEKVAKPPMLKLPVFVNHSAPATRVTTGRI